MVEISARLFNLKGPNFWLSISIFTDNNLGPLESITMYLKDKMDMKFIEIAKLLNRDN